MDHFSKRNPAPPRTCFLLDTSALQIGDVLLSTSDALVSSLIKSATQSPYSHAAIFVHGGGVVIEAVPPGVKLSSVLGRAARDRNNVKVLRMKEDAGALDKDRLCRIAKSHLHKKYSVKGALLSQVPVGALPTANEDELFCSQLIASSYAECGFPLSEKPAHQTTPGDIDKSPLFMDVTESVIIPTEVENLLSVNFIEQGQQDDLSATFHELNMRIVTLTTQACPFIKPLKPRSPLDICALLKLSDRVFDQAQVQQLVSAFTEAVDDHLDRLYERMCHEHRYSFQQPAVVRALIQADTRKERLFSQLKFLEAAAHSHRHSILVRERDLQVPRQVESLLERTSVFAIEERVEGFFIRMLEAERALLASASEGAWILREHLAN